MLAQAGATRSRFQPDVPTLKELGYPVEMASERGLVMPAGTPPAILARLREATEDIAKDAGLHPPAGSPASPCRCFEAGEAWFDRMRRDEARFRDDLAAHALDAAVADHRPQLRGGGDTPTRQRLKSSRSR